VHGGVCPVEAVPPEHGPERHPALGMDMTEETMAGLGPGQISWINGAGDPVTFINVFEQPITWVTGG
jgi:hypothetical protein